MLHILLLILKIIVIILAVLIGILLLALVCVLFVPIRYRMKAEGKSGEEDPLHGQIKITWLLHIVNVIFSYPQKPYLQARIFCFTIFDSSRSKKEAEKEEEESEAIEKEFLEKDIVKKDNVEKGIAEEEITKKETAKIENIEPLKREETDETKEKGKIKKFILSVMRFVKRFFEALKNIEYTIKRIYDRIKKIIENIQYYTDLMQSGIFKSAFAVSKKQLVRILRDVRPERCNVDLLAGTGDPASTGQILAVYGMLYPFIGKNVSIQADFENKVAECDIYIKGKITVIVFLVAAFRLYMDKNIRKLLKMMKREDA